MEMMVVVFLGSISGYLPQNELYSKSISLYDEDNSHLMEERIVYLHTALLKKCSIESSNSIHIKIKTKNDNQNLLEIINDIAYELQITSYSIQICIQTTNSNKNKTVVRGRVLKHMPEKPFTVLQEATDIASEQTFTLEDTNVLYGVGTKYDRYEPEWEEFTNGRKYERRGHIHATIVDKKESVNQQHKTFHLREVFISTASNIEVVLTPVDDTYRIYPIYKEKNKYFCEASKKEIDIVINDINILAK